MEKYLVPQPLAGNDGHLIAEPLVDLKVEGELGIVPLNDNLSGPLNGLSPNATHDGEWLLRSMARWCGCSKGNFGVVDFLPSSLSEHVRPCHMTVGRPLQVFQNPLGILLFRRYKILNSLLLFYTRPYGPGWSTQLWLPPSTSEAVNLPTPHTMRLNPKP